MYGLPGDFVEFELKISVREVLACQATRLFRELSDVGHRKRPGYVLTQTAGKLRLLAATGCKVTRKKVCNIKC